MPPFAVGRWTAAAVLGCAVLLGCQAPAPEEERPATGIENATLRTDRQPIEKRYPQLGAFTSVHWLGGTLGSEWVVHVYLRPDQPVAYLSAMGQ